MKGKVQHKSPDLRYGHQEEEDTAMFSFVVSELFGFRWRQIQVEA
jgi:hypothetical protein